MDTTTDLYFPPVTSQDWETARPAEVGWDADALERAVAFAGERATNAFVIAVDGRIIAERYWDGWDARSRRDIASAQKSVSSTLVGIAQQQGRLKLDDPVSTHLGDGWTRLDAGAERAITVRHIVTMTSGLAGDFTFEAPPGTVWFYNNGAYHQTPRLLETVYGKPLQELSVELLFGPLGIRETQWIARENMSDPNGRAMYGLHATARDLVRFGLCVLAGGVWDGRPVLADRAYLDAATSPSQELNPAYGYLWWLNGQRFTVMPGPNRATVPGPLVPAAPPDLFAALGAMDQKVYVVPSLRCVIARLGRAGGERPAAAGSLFDRELWDVLSAAIPSSR